MRGYPDDAWEQRKLNSLISLTRGLTYKPSDVEASGIHVLRSSNINGESFVFRKDDVFVSEKAVSIPLAQTGDLLITAANGSSHLVGKHAILALPEGYKCVPGGFMLLGKTEEPFFANALLSAPWYRKFISIYAAGGNGVIGNLKASDLEKQDVFFPAKSEREQIGAFFQQIDSAIALHQRKYEKLQLIKESLLGLMFPTD